MLMLPRPTLLIFFCAMTLVAAGLVMVYSASAGRAAESVLRQQISMVDRPDRDVILSQVSAHSSSFAERQFYFAILAILAMFVAFQVGPDPLRGSAGPIMVCALIGLALVYVPGIGTEVNGSMRWLKLGPIRAQPSEFAKLAIIIYFAHFLSQNLHRVRQWRVFAPLYVLSGITCGLIVKEPDLGAAGMIFLTCYIMLAVAGARRTHLALGLIPVLIVLAHELTVDYRRNRLLAFVYPELVDPKDTWQLNQSLTAVATGGLHGLGLGNGPQKYNFLSEAHTDFIYAVIVEETGIIGGLIVMGIYVILTFAAIHVARRVTNSFQALVATGVICIIGVQAFINMSVVLGLLPTKGLTLPLVSYGGSSLIMSCAAIGLLMHVARQSELDHQPTGRTIPVTA
jgi:cell division protein FtsW